MILPFGQAPVPAKVSVKAGSGEASLIRVTYGPHGSGSSASYALSISLASRLRPVTASLGSSLFRLSWKERATPSGRVIFALRASARHTSGNDCTSWPSPHGNSSTGAGAQGREGGLNLQTAAALAPWPTPNAMEGGQTSRSGNRRGELLLGGAAQMAGWATPAKQNGEGGARLKLNTDGWNTLQTQARQTAWATPSARDSKDGRASQETMDKNSRPLNEQAVQLTDSGAMPSGSPAATERPAQFQLNPRFSLWLQGLPIEWASCGERVMRSRHPSRKRSSEPASK